MTTRPHDDNGSMGWTAAICLIVSCAMIGLGPGRYVLRPILDTLGLTPPTAVRLAVPDATFWIYSALGAGLPLLLASVVLATKGWGFSRMISAFGAVLAFVVLGLTVLATWWAWLERLKPDVAASDLVAFALVSTLWFAATALPYLLIGFAGLRLMRAMGWVR